MIQTEADLRAALRQFDKFFLLGRPFKDVPREELEEMMRVGTAIVEFCILPGFEVPADILAEVSPAGRKAIIMSASKMIVDFLSNKRATN